MWKAVLMVLPVSLMAQEPVVPAVPQQRTVVRIGPAFSLDHVDRNVDRTVADAFDPMYDRAGYRAARIGFSAGIDVLVPLGVRTSLLTGIRYVDRGFLSRFQPVRQLDAPLDSLQGQLATSYHFEYAEVPILLRFEFGKRRLRPVVSAGVRTGFLLGAFHVIHPEFPDGRNPRERSGTGGFSTIRLAPTVAAGLVHHTTDRIWTRLEVQGGRDVLPLTERPVRGYLWDAGVLVGVFYAFHRP